MNLYIVTRWGNPHEESGPDGKDTNFLVRADSVENASRIVDLRLQDMIVEIEGNRAVQAHCHHMVRIGDDPESTLEAVIHGPWIERIIIEESSHYSAWMREDDGNCWEPVKEFYKQQSQC